MTNTNTFVPGTLAQQANVFPVLQKGASILVTGAGAFGGWSALNLLRNGFNVTLIDAWGPGHSRSSSGDETRVIRSTYGANKVYFDLNVRALTLWKEQEAIFNQKIFYNTGVLWLCHEQQTPIVDDSLPFAAGHNQHYDYLTKADLQRRFPLVNTANLDHAYFDPYGGYLKAREACQAVLRQFQTEGGTFIQQQVAKGPAKHNRLTGVTLADGNHLQADAYLFACGAWMAQLFPEVMHDVITCTKQEVYYFGGPAAKAKQFDDMPVWIDVDGQDFYYGIAGNANRGFKIGVDIRGEIFDPTHGERIITPEVLNKARAFLAHRFPDLRDAPLLESRVCPYENSPDGNFIFDLHPLIENVFLLGGGSGHGFKHGPALGELVANTLSGKVVPPGLFRIPS